MFVAIGNPTNSPVLCNAAAARNWRPWRFCLDGSVSFLRVLGFGPIPMYFLIAIFGGEKRSYAAMKFFLYTLLGSVFMLLGFLALYFEYGSTYWRIYLRVAKAIDAESSTPASSGGSSSRCFLDSP